MSNDLTWMPAWQIQELIAKGEVSPVEVTDHFLGRIEELNPTLKAFKSVDAAGAREQAKAAEQAVQRGDDLGPLHGIPMSVKEHIAIAGMPVMGMLGNAEVRHADYDDLGIARLRAAGAVLVGTNTMMGTGGRGFNWELEARNPWDPTRAPGWSSSGGAAAAASRMLPITIGSDGGGSTRLPGAYSGVVAVHPTNGRIPSYNGAVESRNNSTITIGPLARDVRDAAITLQVMAGPDGRDFDCIQSEAPDCLTGLEAGVDGMRFAWTDDYGFTKMYAFEESPGVIDAVRTAAGSFNTLGATVETIDTQFEDFWPGYVTTNFLFGGGPTGTMEAPPQEQFIAAMETRGRNWEKFRTVLEEHDLILSVTAQIVAPTIEDWADYWSGKGPVEFPHGIFAPHYTSHTHMFNWLGFPAVNVPAGFINGMPVGLQIVGWPGSEDKIFRAAHAFLSANPRDEHPAVS